MQQQPQLQKELEVPFAILDVRHGVWSDIIQEVEQEHAVKFGRHKNQFKRTILTMHASTESQFAAASAAIQQARNRVFEQTIPIPDAATKLRIIGRNGVRMDSVSRKFGVSIRYNEAELMAYVQGGAQQEVAAAALRLNAFEQQVELTHAQNLHLREHDAAIDAIERKWRVQISNIPNISWKQPTPHGGQPKKPASIYVLVGGKDDVAGAELDMMDVAQRKTVDLAPWLVHKDVVIPLNRKADIAGTHKKRFEHWKQKYNGISFQRQPQPVEPEETPTALQNIGTPALPVRSNLKRGAVVLRVYGPEDKVAKVTQEIAEIIGVTYVMPRERAMQLIARAHDAIAAKKEKAQATRFKGHGNLATKNFTPPASSAPKIVGTNYIKKWEKEDNVTIVLPPSQHSLYYCNDFMTFRIHGRGLDGPSSNFVPSFDPVGPQSNVELNVKPFQKVLDQFKEFQGETDTIMIPRRRVGVVVGVSFKNVNMLQDTFDISLKLRQSNDMVDDGEIVMWGAAENIAAAKIEISKLIGVRHSIPVPFDTARYYSGQHKPLTDLQTKLSRTFNVSLVAITDTAFHLRGETDEAIPPVVEWLNRHIITHMETVQIPQHCIARVIGKQAVNLKEIVEKHKVLIRKPPSKLKGNVNEGGKGMKMVISGIKANVDDAVNAVQELIGCNQRLAIPSEYIAHVVGREFGVLQKWCDKYQVVTTRVRDREGAKTPEFIIWGQTQEHVDNAIQHVKNIVIQAQNLYSAPVDLPEELWGLFIGTRGLNIKDLQEMYNVKVQTPTSRNHHGSAPATSFTVRGDNEDNVHAAIEKIRSLGRAPWAFRNFRETRPTLELEIPASHHGRIVGAGGVNLHQLRSRFGVEMRLPPMDVHSETCIMVGDTEERKKYTVGWSVAQNSNTTFLLLRCVF